MTDNRKAFRLVRQCVIVLLAAVIGITFGHIVSSYEMRFMMNREYCGTYRGIDVYKSGSIDADNFIAHIYMLSAAPEELTSCVDRLYFTGMDLSIPANDTGFGSALGLTQGRTVYISTESYRDDVVFHELFHAYDNASGLPSDSDRFRGIYNIEGGAIPIEAGTPELHPAEVFAEAGALYFLRPSLLKFIAPGLYGYFGELTDGWELMEAVPDNVI